MAHKTALPHSPLKALAWAAFAALWLAFSLSGVSGCKTVEIDPAGTDSVDTTVTGSAIVRITNNVSEDPDSLTFFLFPGNATDFSNANKARRVGGVNTDGTGVFQVPAGTWKLAYENSAGALTAMRDLDSGDWVKSTLAKGGDFSLILTSEGKDVKWNPSFPTDPDIR